MRMSVCIPVSSAVRLAVLGVVAVSASACSQADRFAYDPFSNPFNGRETTGSVSSAPSGGVSSQPLPPPGGYQNSSYTAPAYAPQQPPQQQFPYSQPQSQAQPYRQAAYTPPAQQRMAPPTPLPQYQAQPAEKPGWSAQGGQRVTVQAGDTAYGLGERYGIPASTILQANNLPPGAQLNAGQSVIIPGYRGPAQVQPNPPVKTAKTKPAPARSGNAHTVRSGDTLYSIAREYDVSPRELAAANNFGLDYRVRQGESISLPHAQKAVARAEDPAPKIQQPVYRPDDGTKTTFQQSQPPKQQPVVARATEMPNEVSGGTDFRWPVRGRVISGFGQKPNGQSNDGVNISVPEGTEIKAAEGGVVAYAGNQLKGFGNLVLIRHQGEWVTAYAHASEILVKRGDTVRRGQVIARSGKTGSVTSPQLHFEVRRGASPVDPLSHLPNV